MVETWVEVTRSKGRLILNVLVCVEVWTSHSILKMLASCRFGKASVDVRTLVPPRVVGV